MPESNQPSFGAELRRLRIAAGRKQRDVAEVLGGVSVPFIHDIERGNRKPSSLDKIQELTDLLGESDRADYLAELAVVQRGMISITPKSASQRRMLVMLDRALRTERLTSTKLVKIVKILEN